MGRQGVEHVYLVIMVYSMVYSMVHSMVHSMARGRRSDTFMIPAATNSVCFLEAQRSYSHGIRTSVGKARRLQTLENILLSNLGPGRKNSPGERVTATFGQHEFLLSKMCRNGFPGWLTIVLPLQKKWAKIYTCIVRSPLDMHHGYESQQNIRTNIIISFNIHRVRFDC